MAYMGNTTQDWEKRQREAEANLNNLGKFSYKDYTESDAVKAAKAALDQQMANKPGAYQSQWQNGINKTLNEILNRDQFSYDMNADALYQQYKDQYSTQGKMAMMDTIGQAAALTGGLDNSYAQSVGQQTYQGYMQQLNDRVPELYQLALDQYNQHGQDLLNKYGVLSSQEAVDYGKYRDSVSDWTSERNYLSDAYNAERSWDYGLYSDAYNRAFGEYSTNYTQLQDALNRAESNYRNSVADDQWLKEFNEAKRQYNLNRATQKASGQSFDLDGAVKGAIAAADKGDDYLYAYLTNNSFPEAYWDAIINNAGIRADFVEDYEKNQKEITKKKEGYVTIPGYGTIPYTPIR